MLSTILEKPRLARKVWTEGTTFKVTGPGWWGSRRAFNRSDR